MLFMAHFPNHKQTHIDEKWETNMGLILQLKTSYVADSILTAINRVPKCARSLLGLEQKLQPFPTISIETMG